MLLTSGWTVGRLFRIPVRVHWSMPLLLVWILPEAGWVAFPLLALFMLYVLAHELGHAVVAQDAGHAVDQIMLSPVGGVALIRANEMPANDEIRVAVAGPLVSLVLALAGGLVTLACALAGQDHAARLAGWFLLAPNAGLCLFNLLPAFPMDGGRVLRALLTARRGRLDATRVAASVGRGLALACGVAALAAFGSLRLALVAAVVWLLAGAEWRAEVWRARAASMGGLADDASEWIVSPPPYARPRAAGLWSATVESARVLARRLLPVTL